MEYMTLSNIKYSYDINNGDFKVSCKIPDEIFEFYSAEEIAEYVKNILERVITGGIYGKK